MKSPQAQKRMMLMAAGAIDALLGGVTLLVYFRILPVDISGWDIPRWLLGLLGAVWFFSGLGVFTYYLTYPSPME